MRRKAPERDEGDKKDKDQGSDKKKPRQENEKKDNEQNDDGTKKENDGPNELIFYGFVDPDGDSGSTEWDDDATAKRHGLQLFLKPVVDEWITRILDAGIVDDEDAREGVVLLATDPQPHWLTIKGVSSSDDDDSEDEEDEEDEEEREEGKKKKKERKKKKEKKKGETPSAAAATTTTPGLKATAEPDLEGGPVRSLEDVCRLLDNDREYEDQIYEVRLTVDPPAEGVPYIKVKPVEFEPARGSMYQTSSLSRDYNHLVYLKHMPETLASKVMCYMQDFVGA
eukprot:TRINITY_DN2481_c0_g1_i1.p1 TRINITY_DN2481_c0_g1~~TRINITY_DN2481_c0_g1_i1.p1  ORF type:complete len:282 (+),score=86.16 TRINITY_DN2481_c0_g1_i1:140-985(+)